MQIDELIKNAYVLPALLDLWENPQNEEAKDVLLDAGVDPTKLRKFKHLLEYHEAFLRTRGENYPLLRKGLAEYFDVYLSDIFKVTGFVNKKDLMLDYGAGDGYYSDQFLIDNPDSCVISADKDHSFTKHHGQKALLYVNFEHAPNWYRSHHNEFDIILMSELLHCKDLTGQRYLFESAHAMLKLGGHLIINENKDYAMQWRISKIKGQSRPIIGQKRIMELAYKLFTPTDIQVINNHTINVFRK